LKPVGTSRNVRIKIYKTIILPFVFYGGEETWPLTLMEEHRLRVFENREMEKGTQWGTS
jgi:hypothetical protein